MVNLLGILRSGFDTCRIFYDHNFLSFAVNHSDPNFGLIRFNVHKILEIKEAHASSSAVFMICTIYIFVLRI